jgi:hypothetical protein
MIGAVTLADRLRALRATRRTDFDWAKRKFDGHYHRYAADRAVGQRFGEACLEVADRLAEGQTGHLGAEVAEEARQLLVDIVTGKLGPTGVAERTGGGMETPLVLHRLTGGHREAYFELVAELPELNDYQPTYVTMGPTGKCNVVCPDCIIGGAIFIEERQRLHRTDDVLPHLADAEAAGVRSVALCIGEPTYNTRILFDTFDRIRESPVLEARSMVTNGLFARSPDKARRFFEAMREHLGPDKAHKLMLGVSLNEDLRQVGVSVEATANLLEAYGAVFPGHRMMLQLIMDEGFHHIQNALFRELGARGLLDGWESLLLASEGSHPELRLSNGLRCIVSVMRKQPSQHNPWARPGTDPWVRYFTPEALTDFPLKGLYTYDDDEEADTDEAGLVVHRITLGPDGVYYPDYHFMVAATRPLGTSLPSAVASFRRDPLLSLLLHRGGLNALIATYQAIPAAERLVADLVEPACATSTTGMAAANVLFGDYEVAMQLAERVLTHGVSAPPVEASLAADA